MSATHPQVEVAKCSKPGRRQGGRSVLPSHAWFRTAHRAVPHSRPHQISSTHYYRVARTTWQATTWRAVRRTWSCVGPASAVKDCIPQKSGQW